MKLLKLTLMVVQPYFDEPVRIIGYKKGRALFLTEIGDRTEEFNAEILSSPHNLPDLPTLFEPD